jgi:hypothetical protein
MQATTEEREQQFQEQLAVKRRRHEHEPVPEGRTGICPVCGSWVDGVEGCDAMFDGPDAEWYGAWLAHMPEELRAEYLSQVTPEGTRR